MYNIAQTTNISSTCIIQLLFAINTAFKMIIAQISYQYYIEDIEFFTKINILNSGSSSKRIRIFISVEVFRIKNSSQKVHPQFPLYKHGIYRK